MKGMIWQNILNAYVNTALDLVEVITMPKGIDPQGELVLSMKVGQLNWSRLDVLSQNTS